MSAHDPDTRSTAKRKARTDASILTRNKVWASTAPSPLPPSSSSAPKRSCRLEDIADDLFAPRKNTRIEDIVDDLFAEALAEDPLAIANATSTNEEVSILPDVQDDTDDSDTLVETSTVPKCTVKVKKYNIPTYSIKKNTNASSSCETTRNNHDPEIQDPHTCHNQSSPVVYIKQNSSTDPSSTGLDALIPRFSSKSASSTCAKETVVVPILFKCAVCGYLSRIPKDMKIHHSNCPPKPKEDTTITLT